MALDETMDRREAGVETVLIVDAEVAVRAPLAAYLRDCGLRVIEATDTQEAKKVLAEGTGRVDVILCDAATVGTEAGFEFARWVREEHEGVPVLLAGSIDNAASLAGHICEDGPSLARPYDPSLVADAIRQALAAKARNMP